MTPPPPPTYRLGDRLIAGLGHAEILPDIDVETFSLAGYVWNPETDRWEGLPGAPGTTKGLPLVGAEVSTKHPSFGIVWMSYDLKDGAGRRRWRPGLPPPLDLFGYLQMGGLIEAWNVAYERWVWVNYCVPVLGWPRVADHQWRCAMAKARASGLPGALGKAAEVMGLQTQKDPRGAALMKKLSMPRNPTKTDPRRRVMPLYEHPGYPDGARAADRKRIDSDYADTIAYGEYNETDIVAEAEASAQIPDLTGDELAWWQTHERINQRGVHIDRVGVENCIAVVEQAFRKYNAELLALTGIDAASKVQQLLGWLHSRGVHLDSLDEESVAAALTLALPDDARRVLEIRAAIGSASVKKLFAIRNRLSDDDRLRDLYVYHGAKPGRSTGEGPQPTNLPKAGPETIRCGCGHHYGRHHQRCTACGMPRAPDARATEWNPEVAEQALAVIALRSLEWVEHVYGDALLAIAGCLRALFDAAPGHDLISTDYNSIEAVGLAMLAGEQWRIEVFRTHGKIYETSAAAAFRIPLEQFAEHKEATGQHHPLRQKGKVLELACFSPDTQVLTRRGYVAIVALRCNDMLWDGVEWVSHAGVIAKGVRPVIALDGVRMTPQHLVLCGTSWLEAKQLASSASTLCRALETGSETLPSWAWTAPETSCGSSSGATAAPPPTTSCSQIWSGARRLVATLAQRLRLTPPARSILGLQTSFLATRIAVDSWGGSRRQSAGATTPTTQGTRRTGAGASLSIPAGGPTSVNFWNTLSRFRAGMTRASTWIESMLTAPMDRATFVSSLALRTPRTNDGWPICSSELPTLSDVFDVAHAGPRNRFTIKTDAGHLVVHNCGYGGWLGAAHAFGMPGTDDEITADILAWRAASPAVEWLWGGQTFRKAETPVKNASQPGYEGTVAPEFQFLKNLSRDSRYGTYYFGVEGMAIQAVQNPRQWYDVIRLDGTCSGISYRRHGDVLYCRLPGGRLLSYHRPRLDQSERGGLELSYEGWNTNPKNGPIGWIRMRTWGSRLVENDNQGTCRDILAPACIALEERGYPVVLHVYDEIVSEVPVGYGSIEEYEEIVTVRPAWAHDWPIRAPGGWRAKRYRKG